MSGKSITMSEGRGLRIAAVGDVHFDGTRHGLLRELFADVQRSADVLALLGDLTTHGRPEQMQAFASELQGIGIPVVAVLGNHDYESHEEAACTKILCDAGVHVLDGTNIVIHGVGFAGTKGFCGGFGRGALGPFGERIIKQFVDEALAEALKIEKAMHGMQSDTRVALLHYSPIEATVVGEPEVIFPFLGSSRLVSPLDTMGAAVVFHGHAHHGSMEGETPGGVPVYNVALPLLQAAGMNYRVVTVHAPERRQAGD
jgi:Icc-related predicted phosphoesterase